MQTPVARLRDCDHPTQRVQRFVAKHMFMLSMRARQHAYYSAARVLTTLAEQVGDKLLCQVHMAIPVGELCHQYDDDDLMICLLHRVSH